MKILSLKKLFLLFVVIAASGSAKNIVCSELVDLNNSFVQANLNNELLKKIAKPYQDYLSGTKSIMIDILEESATIVVHEGMTFNGSFLDQDEVGKKSFINRLSYLAVGSNIRNIGLKLQNLNKPNDSDIWQNIKNVDTKLENFFEFIKAKNIENQEKANSSLLEIMDAIVATKKVNGQDILIEKEGDQRIFDGFYNRSKNLRELLESKNFRFLMDAAVHDNFFRRKIYIVLRFCMEKFMEYIIEIDQKYDEIKMQSPQAIVITHSINSSFCKIFYQIGHCFASSPEYCQGDLIEIRKMIKEQYGDVENDFYDVSSNKQNDNIIINSGLDNKLDQSRDGMNPPKKDKQKNNFSLPILTSWKICGIDVIYPIGLMLFVALYYYMKPVTQILGILR